MFAAAENLRTSTKRQETGDVVLVKIGDRRRFYQLLQPTGPLNFYVSYVIVERAHTREVARQDSRAVSVISNNQAPIANQVDQTLCHPTLVAGARDCRVARVATQPVSQLQKQLFAIIQPAIPVKRLSSLFALAPAQISHRRQCNYAAIRKLLKIEKRERRRMPKSRTIYETPVNHNGQT
jgi:hypothetical protein